MNDRGDTQFGTGQTRVPNGTENILPVPSFYVRIAPHTPSDIVDARKSLRIKQTLPIARPLTINVVLAELPWPCRGKENKASVPAQRRNQGVG
jgi:hypothetical protein